MANLAIAGVCNLKCPYCFAKGFLQETKAGSAPTFISLPAFEERLDFLERSGIEQVRLIGGEPTLHPQFPELLHRVRQRKKSLLVFSHGLIPEPALRALEAFPPAECTVLINMNAANTDRGLSATAQSRRHTTVRRLGPRALLGFNIYTTRFHLDELLALIKEADCHKAIRLGLAHTTLAGDNACLHPKHYPIVGQRLAQFARIAAATGVVLEFDCGFVRCMFAPADLESLHRFNADLGWHCNPILDVDLNGQVIHCFPLAGKGWVPLTASVTAATLRDHFTAWFGLYRLAGIYKECSTCLFKQRGECSGGCLAGTLQRFRQTPLRLTVPAAVTFAAAIPLVCNLQ